VLDVRLLGIINGPNLILLPVEFLPVALSGHGLGGSGAWKNAPGSFGIGSSW
jgi:hypothetical protein